MIITKFKLFENHNYWGNVAAGILPISKATKRILVSHRSDYVNEPNTHGIWGGKLDNDNETISQVAKREFKEETQYMGEITLYPAYIYRDGDFSYHNFIASIPNEFTPKLDWETKDFNWLTLDELITLPNKHFGLEALLDDKESMQIIKRLANS